MNKLLAAFALTCSILALCQSFAGVLGAGEQPKLSSVSLVVSPLTQGVGGQVHINTYVQVNGTC